MIDRRRFLELFASGAAAVPLASLVGCAGDEIPPGVVVGAFDDADGIHNLAAFDLEAGTVFVRPLSLRGHASVVDASRGHVALVSRRPGTELSIVDAATGELVAMITSERQRHFLGHAVFDGDNLYTTESSFDDSASPDLTPRDSVIGVYSASDYRRLGEFTTHGVGAHELLVAGDGRALVVANGGIYTHPSRPREKLNIETMEPSLVYIDAANGALISQHLASDHQLSIRHIARSSDGTIAIGMQYEGEPEADVPLVALHRAGGDIIELEAPAGVIAGLDQYVGSVAVNTETSVVVATSPRGDRVDGWAIEDGAYIGGIDATDVSGVTSLGDVFVVSSGTGQLYIIDAQAMTLRRTVRAPGMRWDNHLAAI